MYINRRFMGNFARNNVVLLCRFPWQANSDHQNLPTRIAFYLGIVLDLIWGNAGFL